MVCDDVLWGHLVCAFGCICVRQVAFVYMPKDEAWASRENIKRTASILQAAGHPVMVSASR